MTGTERGNKSSFLDGIHKNMVKIGDSCSWTEGVSGSLICFVPGTTISLTWGDTYLQVTSPAVDSNNRHRTALFP